MPAYFHAITGERGDGEIAARAAKPSDTLGSIRFTSREVIFRKGLRLCYLPLERLEWAFRRVEESHVNLGCCGGVLEEYHIVMQSGGKQVRVTFDRLPDAEHFLAMLGEHAPQCALGYTEENRKRFTGKNV